MQLNLVAYFEKNWNWKNVLLQRAKKIGCFCNRPFWQGQKDSFSSLDARRSGRLYRAKGHGIHCRSILVLLQEANKKIGCFRNRPFWQGQKDSFSSLDARRSGRLYRAKGHGIHCRSILVLLQEANKKIGCFRNRPFWQGQKDSNPQQRFWRPTCYHYTIPLSTYSV